MEEIPVPEDYQKCAYCAYDSIPDSIDPCDGCEEWAEFKLLPCLVPIFKELVEILESGNLVYKEREEALAANKSIQEKATQYMRERDELRAVAGEVLAEQPDTIPVQVKCTRFERERHSARSELLRTMTERAA